MSVPEHDMAGHRARSRQRLAETGGDGLLDHELIEYLLALAIPRRDTKRLAKLLLKEFGGIGGLLTADPEALSRVPGMGDTSIAAIKITTDLAVKTNDTLVLTNVQPANAGSYAVVITNVTGAVTSMLATLRW